MKHHAFTAALGLLIAATLFPVNSAQAASADPTGIWRKAEQGERPGKIEVFRCGSGQRLLCAKIVWLQDPLDSRGRPLHDVRNENPSMRDRPILGLPIISGMQPVGPNVWKGNIYNPEDGNTYSATLTLVSRSQISLKGCKAWLLCGERTWLRTTAPEPVAEPEPQIEASAEPETPAEPAKATAAAEQAPAQEEKDEEDAFAEAEVLTPAPAQDAKPGYRFLNASTSSETPTGFTGENVPSMFAMTKPVASENADDEAGTDSSESGAPAAVNTAAAQPAQVQAAQPAAPKPKPQAIQANAAGPGPAPQAAPTTRTTAVPPAQQQGGTVEGAETQGQMGGAAETQTAETTVATEPQLTRRERRLLRRQQKQMQQEGQGLLPWLR